MDFQILSLLTGAEVEYLVSELSRVKFVDGRSTAAGIAGDVKHNLQAERSGTALAALDEMVFARLRDNAEFQLFAHPKRVLAPSYSRYEPGMDYGSHIDSAVMGGSSPLRTDFAMTVFLSQPDSYDGGELAMESPVGEQEIKLSAGEAIVYPATTLHRVTPVRRGVRLAAVTWIQSTVPDSRLRPILYDLGKAVASAEAAGDKGQIQRLAKAYHNLLRYAADL